MKAERLSYGVRRGIVLAGLSAMALTGCAGGTVEGTAVTNPDIQACDLVQQPPIEGHSRADQFTTFMSALRTLESHNQWDIIQMGHEDDPIDRRATGAYQYSGRAWNNYGGKAEARDALPVVQEERAERDVRADMAYAADHEQDASWRELTYARMEGIEAALKPECEQGSMERGYGNMVMKIFTEQLLHPEQIIPVPR